MLHNSLRAELTRILGRKSARPTLVEAMNEDEEVLKEVLKEVKHEEEEETFTYTVIY